MRTTEGEKTSATPDKPKIAVAISGSFKPQYIERMQWVRDTWLKCLDSEKYFPFFYCFDQAISRDFWNEKTKTLHIAGIDDYNRLSAKVARCLTHLINNTNCTHAWMMVDDCYVNCQLFNHYDLVSDYDYVGCPLYLPHSKDVPWFMSGAAYCLSREALKIAVQHLQSSAECSQEDCVVSKAMSLNMTNCRIHKELIDVISPLEYKLEKDTMILHYSDTKEKMEQAHDYFYKGDMKETKKIGLCMIVKNESKIIERCLNSVKPLIDYVSIVDTGSTDNTIDIINNWMRSNDIEGQVLSEPWRDFAYNRSFALKKLREKKHIDYALMIDADEILMHEEGIDFSEIKKDLTLDLYHINCKSSGIEYLRSTLTKNEKPYFYKGIVHEYLECEEPTPERGTLPKIWNVPLQDSFRNENVKKFQDDAKLLEKALETETDPFLLSRYVFYLAQSYGDCEEKEKAIYWYEKRSKLGFWDQEVYISLYRVAQLKESLGYPEDDIIQSYLRAHEVCSWRLESLHRAIAFCRTHGRDQQAFMLASFGVTISKPEDGLFLETWVWDYGIYDEYAISAYWAKHYKESVEMNEKLINKIPESQKERILNNLKISKSALGI